MQLLKHVGDRSPYSCWERSRHGRLHAYRVGLALSLGFLLLTAGSAIHSQEAPDNSTAPANTAGGSPENQGERARLLFLLQRPAGLAPKPDDLYAQLSATLRNAIDAANRYDIVLFGTDQPSIKRALLEHTLAVSDLVEPISPEALRHIARGIGARYALTVKPVFDRQGLKTEIRYDEDMGTDTWRNGLTEQIAFEAQAGKRHFKPTELIALSVDAICARLNVPSHLAANIKVGPTRVVAARSTEKKAGASTQSGQKSDGTTQIARTNPVSQTNDDTTIAAPPPPSIPTDTTSNDVGATGADKPSPSRSVPKKQPRKSVADAGGTQAGSAGNPQTPPVGRRQRQPAAVSNPGPAASPPVLAPAPARADYVTSAMAARKDGDISTEITLLRKAVTATPHDPNLRRQLIQAYQDRHMTDLALAEAERAVQLIPADNTLQRLYGDALLAKGNGAGALKIYRDVIARDPADVAAQVALADALMADNQYAEAMTAYKTAATADPNSPLPHRRLARVYARRADSDPTQYQESLKELTLSRQLISGGDTDTYLGDYVALMRQIEQRLRDMADELQNSYQAAVQGTHKPTEVSRTMADLKERAAALADYLDHVPVAVGHEGAQAHYAEGAALLVQAIVAFRKVLESSNGRIEDAQGLLRVARVDILHELATANKLLMGASEQRRTASISASTHSQDTAQ